MKMKIIICSLLFSFQSAQLVWAEPEPTSERSADQRQWCLIVGNSGNASVKERENMKTLLSGADGVHRIFARSGKSGILILFNGSPLEAATYLKELSAPATYQWADLLVVEGIGLQGVRERWINAVSVVELDKSYSIMTPAQAIVIKTSSGLLIATSGKLFKSISKYSTSQPISEDKSGH